MNQMYGMGMLILNVPRKSLKTSVDRQSQSISNDVHQPFQGLVAAMASEDAAQQPLRGPSHRIGNLSDP